MVFLPLLPQAWWSLGAGSRQHCLITIIDTDDNNADADDDDGHGDDDDDGDDNSDDDDDDDPVKPAAGSQE